MYLIHGTSMKLDAGDTKMNKIPAREEYVGKHCQEWEVGVEAVMGRLLSQGSEH